MKSLVTREDENANGNVGSAGNDGGRLHYFAFGSNMHHGRLRRRLKDLRKVCNAYLPGYRFRTNKNGSDGSSKANIEPSNGDGVWGVVWSIPVAKKPVLDREEGYKHGRSINHYEPCEVTVYDENGRPVNVMTYIACEEHKSPDDGAMFTWYHSFITRGASDNGLPLDYQRFLETLHVKDDDDRVRHRTNTDILDRIN